MTNEQQADAGKKAAEPTQNSDNGNKSQEIKSIADANAAAERLAKESERMEKNIAELRELNARITLGGTTSAGQTPAPKKELSPKEYIAELQRGKIPQKE